MVSTAPEALGVWQAGVVRPLAVDRIGGQITAVSAVSDRGTLVGSSER